jgi:hypothetical protein
MYSPPPRTRHWCSLHVSLPFYTLRERHARAVLHMPLRHPLHGGLLTSHALHTPSSTLSQLFHTSLIRFHPSVFLRSRPTSAIGPVLALTWCPQVRVWVAVAWSQVALLAPRRSLLALRQCSRLGVSESFRVVVEGGGVTGERGRCATPLFVVVVCVGQRVSAPHLVVVVGAPRAHW